MRVYRIVTVELCTYRMTIIIKIKFNEDQLIRYTPLPKWYPKLFENIFSYEEGSSICTCRFSCPNILYFVFYNVVVQVPIARRTTAHL